MPALLLIPLLLLAACQGAPAMLPVLQGMPGTANSYRPAGPPATVARNGAPSATLMPFRQANGPGRATVSLLEDRLQPDAHAVDAPGFEIVFIGMLDGARIAAERVGETLELRSAGTIARNGETLLRCGQMLHGQAEGPPLGLWCAGVVAERLAVIHVRTRDNPADIATATEFAGITLLALRQSAARSGPDAPARPSAPPEYRTRGRDVQT